MAKGGWSRRDVLSRSVYATAGVGAAQLIPNGALEDFFVGPDVDVQRENDLKPGGC
jgi:hypothetical protein